jgi:hypothetical protein
MFFFLNRNFIVPTIPLSRFLFYLLHFEISKFGTSKIVCLKKSRLQNVFNYMFIIAFYFIVDFYIKKI